MLRPPCYHIRKHGARETRFQMAVGGATITASIIILRVTRLVLDNLFTNRARGSEYASPVTAKSTDLHISLSFNRERMLLCAQHFMCVSGWGMVAIVWLIIRLPCEQKSI